MIKSCDKNMINFEDPASHGWCKSKNTYTLEFYTGPQFPELNGNFNLNPSAIVMDEDESAHLSDIEYESEDDI